MLSLPPQIKIIPIGLLKVLAALIVFGSGFVVLLGLVTSTEDQLVNQITQLKESESRLQTEYEEAAFNSHLDEIDLMALEASKAEIEEEYARLTSEASQERLAQLESIYELYNATISKLERNQGLGLSEEGFNEMVQTWGELFLNQEFSQLTEQMTSEGTQLDTEYQNYLATLPTATPKPVVVVPPSTPAGYSYQTVSNSRGTFGVYLIKMSLNEVQVRTLTANSDDCVDNCPAKPLAQYIQDVNGYAGMHGTYFCPPDYSSCQGKVNSYDFAVYNSSLGKWLNSASLGWNNLGLMTFNGNTPTFYREVSSYGGASVTAGISNFPSLLENGNYAVNEGSLTSYQRDVRGARGAIGFDNSSVYLTIVTGATVPDTAYVMQSLGVQNALNLDGGGSSAMFIAGGYKVGPGRSLPNAIVLFR